MKRFIVSVLCVSVFFIGLGSLADKVGAKFKSDEKALELIKRARVAIGGEANIASVRSLSITGKATQSIAVDGANRSEQGDLEINMELPNQFSKSLKLGNGGEAKGLSEDMDVLIVRKEVSRLPLEKIEGAEGKKNFVIVRKGEGEPALLNQDGTPVEGKHKFVIRKGDGNVEEFATEDGKKIAVDKEILHAAKGGVRNNELFRTAFALLLSAPEGVEVSYTYAGEGDVDGNSCDIVAADTNGESFKLYLDKSTSLPRMISFESFKPFVIKLNKDAAQANGEKERFTAIRNFADRAEKAEFQIKFSDYRSVGGLQMPFKWTQTVGGQTDQTVDIVNYDINPANIAEKFAKPAVRTMFRTAKPQ
ncbi:MAG TPA: hypothetical protein VF556_11695 [Pyrinomonadaceae bacterium]|jgi:hypothetical protein